MQTEDPIVQSSVPPMSTVTSVKSVLSVHSLTDAKTESKEPQSTQAPSAPSQATATPSTPAKPLAPASAPGSATVKISPNMTSSSARLHHGGTGTTCQNCHTTNTPLWRRDESGQVLCNACGLFLKLHGRPRPISLKTDVIKSRNRVRINVAANGATTMHSSNAPSAPISIPGESLDYRPRVEYKGRRKFGSKNGDSSPNGNSGRPDGSPSLGPVNDQHYVQGQLPPVSSIDVYGQHHSLSRQYLSWPTSSPGGYATGGPQYQLPQLVSAPPGSSPMMMPSNRPPPQRSTSGGGQAFTAINGNSSSPSQGSSHGQQMAGSASTTVLDQLSSAASQSPYLTASQPESDTRGREVPPLATHSAAGQPADSPSSASSESASRLSPIQTPASDLQALKSRVKELELVNDLFQSRVQELETAESRTRSELYELEKKHKLALEELEAARKGSDGAKKLKVSDLL